MWKEYFVFNRKEQKGILSLIAILTLIILITLFLDFVDLADDNDYESFNQDVTAFVNTLEVDENYAENRLNRYILARYDTLELFAFDPNTLDKEKWKLLGLTNKQIRTIENYRQKGGRFVDKDDFKKIYGIRTKQFQLLKPYIDIKQTKNKRRKNKKFASYKDLKTEKTAPKHELFRFDPNQASKDTFLLLGLSEKQANTIINYRNKGGKFVKPSDLLKIRRVSKQKINELLPYVRIAESPKKALPVFEVELNTADTAELKKIKGIGNYYAREIVWYRNKLGGYFNINQLLEIKKMRKKTFDKIKKYLKVDPEKIRKMNLNTIEIKDLTKHPYFDYSKAKKIVEYRKKTGNFTDLTQLVEMNIILPNDFEKIAAYLTLH
ncbi:MAG: hypothetical protein CSA05_01530 [Bacteroidia bacterium]|nr:MAG: hypothetical protein CSB01_01340 [Bacteroidia bacterium]PIE86222.1 MAG: hypothetical protein CSA05_01530 [Bacteroidia bacterium]